MSLRPLVLQAFLACAVPDGGMEGWEEMEEKDLVPCLFPERAKGERFLCKLSERSSLVHQLRSPG